MHFTTLVYPTGYTALLPGAVENMPGSEKQSVNGEEGTIKQDGDKLKDLGTIAKTAGVGAGLGGLASESGRVRDRRIGWRSGRFGICAVNAWRGRAVAGGDVGADGVAAPVDIGRGKSKSPIDGGSLYKRAGRFRPFSLPVI